MGFETSMDLILGYKIKDKDLGNFVYSMFNQQDNTGLNLLFLIFLLNIMIHLMML